MIILLPMLGSFAQNGTRVPAPPASLPFGKEAYHNARADTAAEKPSFCDAFKKRRCLVLADGFYEWQKAGKTKQPYHIRMKDARPFAIAGLWERWGQGDDLLESCTILTTEPNELLRSHSRPDASHSGAADYDKWLDSAVTDSAKVKYILDSYPADA